MDLPYETQKAKCPKSTKKAPQTAFEHILGYKLYEKDRQNAPQAHYDGTEAIKYFTDHGVPVKDFYARGADSDKATFICVIRGPSPFRPRIHTNFHE